MISKQVQELMDYFVAERDLAEKQSEKFSTKSPERCNALMQRSFAFSNAILKIHKIFNPDFFREEKEVVEQTIATAQHNKLKKKIAGLEQRLSNPKFLENASKDVVLKTQEELVQLKQELINI